MKVDININIAGMQSQKASFQFAERWDDIPAVIYPALVGIYLDTDKSLDKYDKTGRALTLLAFEAWPVISTMEAEELYDLLPLVDWVFNKLDLKKNFLPELIIEGKKFLGPIDEMENLRFAEWCAADTFFVNYAESEDIHQLHQLAAVLYRPAGIGDEYNPDHVTWRGDCREKFNDQLLKSRTKLMATLPEVVIQGIYLFYASCRKVIIDGYEETFPQTKKSKGKSTGWLDIYDDLRADPKYAGPNTLDEELLHSVLFSLERSNIKMNELKEKYDL